MFAPKIAKTQTKAIADSTNGRAHQRSTLVAHQPGHSPAERALLLQRTIGNQAMLRLLAQRPGSLTGNEPDGDREHEAASENMTAQEAPRGVAWDLSKIPAFLPERIDQSHMQSPLATTPPPDAIQAKLVIGEVNDPLEHEADRVADQVMRMSDPDVSPATAPPQLNRRYASCEEGAQTLQINTARSSEAVAGEAPPIVHEALQSSGQSLDLTTRDFFEPRFGHDFSGVRVHADAKAAESARAINAVAYTVGRDITFGAGRYTPATVEGSRLLAHELTHVIQQKSVLQRQAIPEPSASELSKALLETERKKLIVVTSAVIFDVDPFTAKMPIPLPTGVTVRFASGVPTQLRNGLKNVASMIIPKPLELNSTITLPLNLEPYGGDYGAYRFTYVEHKPKKGKPTQEVLIERLGAIGLKGLSKSQGMAAQKKFDAHGFKRGSGWSDLEFESTLSAIAQIPDSILSPVGGIIFTRDRRSNPDNPKACAHYNEITHSIVIFDCLIPVSVRDIVHEVGHAVDLLPLRRAWSSLKQKQQILKTAFAQFEDPPGSGHYSFPSTEQVKFNKLKANITTAERALTATRSESGHRYQEEGVSGEFKLVEGGIAAGSIEFRKAAEKDGRKRITSYSNKEWQEYYAESFSLYITDPVILQLLRPNVYAFFRKKHPKR